MRTSEGPVALASAPNVTWVQWLARMLPRFDEANRLHALPAVGLPLAVEPPVANLLLCVAALEVDFLGLCVAALVAGLLSGAEPLVPHW